MNRLLSLLALTAALTGCGPKSAAPPAELSPERITAAQQRWPDTDAAKLAQGRQLFVDRCGKCHDHPDVQSQSAEKWPEIMKIMGPKAKLEADAADNVLRFVLSAQ